MSNKGEHLEYVAQKGLFNVDCSHEIFSYEELQILEKWDYWFMGLTSGDLQPFTEAQERFIKVMNKELKPETVEERSWFKYLGRKAVEKKYGDSLKVKYIDEDNTFYSQQDLKKMSKINYGTMNWNHRRGWTEK